MTPDRENLGRNLPWWGGGQFGHGWRTPSRRCVPWSCHQQLGCFSISEVADNLLIWALPKQNHIDRERSFSSYTQRLCNSVSRWEGGYAGRTTKYRYCERKNIDLTNVYTRLYILYVTSHPTEKKLVLLGEEKPTLYLLEGSGVTRSVETWSERGVGRDLKWDRSRAMIRFSCETRRTHGMVLNNIFRLEGRNRC